MVGEGRGPDLRRGGGLLVGGGGGGGPSWWLGRERES